MKKLSILALAAVGLLVGACSSDKDVADQGSQDPFKGREGGFIKVGINLPVQPQVSTRAWEESDNNEPTLDDGLATEYAVDNCILLLFEGTTEAEATLKQVETVTDFSNFTDDPNQITTSATKTVELLSAPSSNLYALAVVNGKNVIEQGTDITKVKIIDAQGAFTEKSGITLADLQGSLVHYNTAGQQFIYEKDSKKYFFMTNAVLSLEQGGTVKPATGAGKLHTLAPVDATRIYQTKAEADAASALPSCDIYVERGVAKVTIEGENGTDYLSITGLKDGNGTAKTGKATILLWAIDNKNEASYVVRNASPFAGWDLISFGNPQVDGYRFIGANPVDGGQSTKVADTGYRTYWAIDPNYGSNWAEGQFITTPISQYSSAVGATAPQYCYENTFPVEKQQHNQTTRVVFKVKLTPEPQQGEDDDFYTIGVDKKTMFTLDDVKKKIAAALMSNTTFATWLTDNCTANPITYEHIDLNVTANDYNVLTLTSVTIKEAYRKTGSTGVFDDATVISTVSAQVGKVTKYEDGYAFYQLRIKHFGDDLTPWNNGEYTDPAPKESSIDDIYPTTPGRDANYLGRYGMVRNNWYTIRLGAIAKIGSATVPVVNRNPPTNPDPDDPEKPDHPDDELEEAYIKARVNILSWAKRVQNWNLK